MVVAVEGSQRDRYEYPYEYPCSSMLGEPPGVQAPPLPQRDHPRLHSPVHSNAVMGGPWRPDGRQLTPAPSPPPTLGGAIQVVCPRSPPIYRGCSVASGTSPAGPMGREALSAPWDPFNCRGGMHRPWDAGPYRQATPPVPCGNQGLWGLPSRTSSPTRPRALAVVGRPSSMSL